jgi:hypothetical protein
MSFNRTGSLVMRIVGCLLFGLMFFGTGLQATFGEEPTAEPSKAEAKPVAQEAKPVRQYAVKFRFIGEGLSDLTSPEVMVNEGEKKMLVDTESKSFLIGKKKEKSNPQAKRELAEGIVAETTVQESDEDQVILDLAVEMSCISGTDPKTGQVRWNAEKFRVIDSVTLDKKTIAEFGHFSLEIVVKDMGIKDVPNSNVDTTKTAAVTAATASTTPTNPSKSN